MSDHKTSLAAYATSIWTFIAGIFSSLTANDVALYIGIICTLGTFLVNWYYKRQHLRLIANRICDPFPTLMSEDAP